MVSREQPKGSGMTRFCRVMATKERTLVMSNQIIPTSRDGCNWYPPNAVVFLFDLSTPSERTAEEAIDAILEAVPAVNWRLDFEAQIPLEPDGSGWANHGSVIHRGPIPLSACQNPRWTQLMRK
jgi:hypothetical protein